MTAVDGSRVERSEVAGTTVGTSSIQRPAMATSAGQDVDAWLDTARPRLRPGVRVGPGLLAGTTTTHVVADSGTGAYLKVGRREAFLITRLDGSASLKQIGAQYAHEFHRVLGSANWSQLLALLARHALLEPADEQRLQEIRDRARNQRRESGRTALHWRVPIPGAISAVNAAVRWGGWLFHPLFVILLTVTGVTVTIVLAAQLPAVTGPLGSTPHGWTAVAAAAALAWLIIVGHELGHGVACVRFGGRPVELGLMWRFPLVAPYCKVDDVVSFARSRDRVMTAYAGVYVNLVGQIPLGALWWFTDPGSWWHDVAAFAAGLNAMSVVVNLVPVLQLDGYHMLEGALGAFQLQRHTVKYVGTLGRRTGATAGTGAYSRRGQLVYTAYAAVSLAVLVPAVVLVLTVWFRTLNSLWGPAVAAGTLGLETVLLAAFLRWAVRRRRTSDGA